MGDLYFIVAAGLGGKNGVRVWQVASGRISFSDKEYKGKLASEAAPEAKEDKPAEKPPIPPAKPPEQPPAQPAAEEKKADEPPKVAKKKVALKF